MLKWKDLFGTCMQCLAYKEEMDKKLEEFMLKVKEEIGNRFGDRVKEVLAQVPQCRFPNSRPHHALKLKVLIYERKSTAI